MSHFSLSSICKCTLHQRVVAIHKPNISCLRVHAHRLCKLLTYVVAIAGTIIGIIQYFSIGGAVGVVDKFSIIHQCLIKLLLLEMCIPYIVVCSCKFWQTEGTCRCQKAIISGNCRFKIIHIVQCLCLPIMTV